MANTWETNPQIDSDHEWTRWFSDPKMFRDCRFDNGKWVGPPAVLALLPIELTEALDD